MTDVPVDAERAAVVDYVQRACPLLFYRHGAVDFLIAMGRTQPDADDRDDLLAAAAGCAFRYAMPVKHRGLGG